jgi:hypothetical protein
MTSPAQVFALTRALYGVPETADLVVEFTYEKESSILSVGVGTRTETLHKTRVSANTTSPLEVLRNELISALGTRMLSTLKALLPLLKQLPMPEPLVELALMLSFSRAYIELRRVVEPASGIGGERGRAAQHAYEDAAAALMAHVKHRVN